MQAIKASEARRIAQARLNTDEALEDIYTHITSHAKKGLFELSYKAEFDLVDVVARLTEEGYDVDAEYDNELRVVCVIHISW